MSDTIPFTLIEGAMALPRLRPLGHLPAPFGSEWSLLPPSISFRHELRALYAAVLRTFCLSVEEMRALCRWTSKQHQAAHRDPGRVGVAAGNDGDVTAGVIASEARVAGSAAALSDTTGPAAARAGAGAGRRAGKTEPVWRGMEIPPTEAVRLPPGLAGQRRAPLPMGMLAGGACAIGGAAVLAWLALGHPAQRPASAARSMPEGVAQNNAVPANAQPVRRGAGAGSAAVPAASPGVAGADAFARAQPGAQTAASASQGTAPRVTPAISQPRVATAANANSASTVSTVSNTPTLFANPATTAAQTGSGAAHRPRGRREVTYSAGAEAVRGAPRILSRTEAQAARHLGYASEPHMLSRGPRFGPRFGAHSTSSRSATHAAARPSSAGAYSPLAPAMLGHDEYASVTLSAATHLRGIAPAAQGGSATTSSAGSGIDTNSTEWMSRMSQRRVTDIPDQFSR